MLAVVAVDAVVNGAVAAEMRLANRLTLVTVAGCKAVVDGVAVEAGIECHVNNEVLEQHEAHPF